MSEGFVEKTDFESFKFNIRKSIKAKGMKMQVQNWSLTDDFVLKLFHRKVQFIDPNGANRIIMLPYANKLDGAPWFKPAKCQNCECEGVHIFTEKFSADQYFHIYNTSDSEEDLIIKYWARNYTTQSVFCDEAETKHHDAPVFVDADDPILVMTISKNEGGIAFCNGGMWRGFLGGQT